jgi:hypothetical protein
MGSMLQGGKGGYHLANENKNESEGLVSIRAFEYVQDI